MLPNLIQDFDVEAADFYDDHGMGWRVLVYLLAGVTRHGIWREMHQYEQYCQRQSLQRQINRLYYQRILEPHHDA